MAKVTSGERAGQKIKCYTCTACTAEKGRYVRFATLEELRAHKGRKHATTEGKS